MIDEVGKGPIEIGDHQAADHAQGRLGVRAHEGAPPVIARLAQDMTRGLSTPAPLIEFASIG